ncbi:hypothetical protein EHH54_39020 [Rhizobium leguminosarum]|uniref:hypothetical protein n=1 Tax=Rhizobium leguminosarum TaxID=384 RepID=UPI000FEC412B|nr:hypothetical protein [Rhizobium leguminosarum]RWX22599.1 hypothetical protein EHH54_39020 [Rhizobium leguminosarum]
MRPSDPANDNAAPISPTEIVRLHDGNTIAVTIADKSRGIYMAGDRVLYRHEFSPVKWAGGGVGNTGIGVCAANGSGQQGAF